MVGKLAGLENREQALELKGRTVACGAMRCPSREQGKYYLADLVGLEVVNERGHAPRRGEANVFERRAGRDRGGGRQDAADSVGRRGGQGSGLAEEASRSGMGGGLVIRFDVVTLFPEMFAAVAGSGITSRALDAGLWSLTTWNPRDFTTDNYRTVDDRPYGGGPGMVMLAEPLERALDAWRRAADEAAGRSTCRRRAGSWTTAG